MLSSGSVSLLAGAAGLVVGWFVSGSQRVTEKLTEERRAAYAALLQAADEAHEDPGADPARLREAVAGVELAGSDLMLGSGLVRRLTAAVSAPTWEAERERFLQAARLESQRNSVTYQLRHRRLYR